MQVLKWHTTVYMTYHAFLFVRMTLRLQQKNLIKCSEI